MEHEKKLSETKSITSDEKYDESSLEIVKNLSINSEDKDGIIKASLLDKEDSEIIVNEDNSISVVENLESNKEECDSLKKEEENKKEIKNRKDPAAIPKKGYFFEHDDRESEKKVATISSLNATEFSSKKIPNRNNRKNKKSTNEIIETDNRWLHDRFDLNDQRPKTRQELIKRYGYDIREKKIEQIDKNKSFNFKNENKIIINSKYTKNQTIDKTKNNSINKQEEIYDDEFNDNEQRNILIKQHNENQDIKISQLRRKKNIDNQTSLSLVKEKKNNHIDLNQNTMNKFQSYKNSNHNSSKQNSSQLENESVINVSNRKNNFSKQDGKFTNSFDDNYIKKNITYNDQLNSDVPKRYSSIRNQTQNKNHNNFLVSNSINQQLNSPSLDQTNNYQQFLLQNNHSSIQHNQNWQNNNSTIFNHHQSNQQVNSLNLQAINSNGTINNPACSNSPSIISQHQMTALINNQLYYVQPNDYTQLSAHDYGTVTVLQTNPIYFENLHQQNNTVSSLSQVNSQRKSKAIPIINPKNLN